METFNQSEFWPEAQRSRIYF